MVLAELSSAEAKFVSQLIKIVVRNINENANQCSPRRSDSNLVFYKNKSNTETQQVFKNAGEVIAKTNLYIPAYLYRPQFVRDAASWFCKNFSDLESKVNKNKYQGKVLFSIKSNPGKKIAQEVFDNGVVNFDVASIDEVRQVSDLLGDEANLYFMHPVKAKEVISEAYFKYSVRDFSFDGMDELNKIREATGDAKDLSLHLRIKMACESSAVDLSGKFGIEMEKSGQLAKEARKIAKNFGVCFHVGSQCMDPRQYKIAIMEVSEFFMGLKIKIDSFDIGGGFPSSYPELKTKTMSQYLAQIKEAIAATAFDEDCQILCEPGRAIVAGGESLLVKVEARKDKMLYINDGTYGGLFDAGVLGFSYFCEAFSATGEKKDVKSMGEFGFYGPTCDSLDIMKGPFLLPENIKAGDYIEIHNLGAYSKSLRTTFNGYGDIFQFEVANKVPKRYCQSF